MPSNDTILNEVWRSRHRIILILLAAHPPVLFGLGLYHGTDPVTCARIPAFSLPDVLFGMRIAAGFGLLALVPQLGRPLRTGLTSIGLPTVSAVLIYFSEGYIEAHFHFFVLGILYMAVHHECFRMTTSGFVYNHTAAVNNPFAWAVIHAVFVLRLTAALTVHWYSAMRSREEIRRKLRQAESFEE